MLQIDNVRFLKKISLKKVQELPDDYPLFLYTNSQSKKISDDIYHPVLIAQNGLVNLVMSEDKNKSCRSYSKRLLSQAIFQKDYVIFPYNFEYHVSCLGRITPPFYSAMAQGEALSLFSMCYKNLHDDHYRDISQRIVKSLLLTKDEDEPWFSFIENGYLFFEEAPWKNKTPKILNGFMFVIIGLLNYLTLVNRNDELAKLFAEASLKTLIDWLHFYRVEGNISKYWLLSDNRSLGYHLVHIKQLYLIYRSTRIEDFLRYKNLLEKDLARFGSLKGIFSYIFSRFKHKICK